MLIIEYLFFTFFCYFLFILFNFKNNLSFYLISFLLNIYHFLISYIFLIGTSDKVVDSSNYYYWATERFNGIEFGSGTNFIVYIVYYISKIFPNYNIVFLIFSTISSLVILKLFSYCYNYYDKKHISNNSFYLITLFLLLPGFHYWTVSIGKDCLVLVGLYFFYISYFKKNIVVMVMSLLLLFFVRIHIFAIILLCLVVAEFFHGYFKSPNIGMKSYRIFISILTVPLAIYLFYILFDFIQKYSSDGFDNVDGFLDSRADVYSDKGSGAWLSNQPYLIKIIAFLWGGVPWVTIDLLTVFSMIEGSLVIFFIYIILKNYKIAFKNNKNVFTILMMFVAGCTLFFALISNNLGVMVRMRVMIYLPLVVAIMFTFYKPLKMK